MLLNQQYEDPVNDFLRPPSSSTISFISFSDLNTTEEHNIGSPLP
ncbi:hypothetical protein SLEP1_g47513 [Rubroshorea leprosula]|uniref:Uncharacterized protein n=1 Tax=Rubroshorea leprosula TaxID=152421 RepID=A0AAV5LQV6_9ROSI|nr:hypothetical protein SLEP1_g47513 [Rubroshorea leprosula]